MSMVNPGQYRIWIFKTGWRAAAAGLALAIMLVLMLGSTEAVQARTYQVIHDFTGGLDGGSPRSSLVFDASGNLYGTASTGGSGNPASCAGACGVVWQIAPC